MDTEYERSRIERAKRDLYQSKEDGVQQREAPVLSHPDIDVANNWKDTTIVTERTKKNNTGTFLLKLIVVFAVLSTFASGGYLLYQLVDPFSKPSDKNIQIVFDIPVGVTPGVPADIIMRISNLNRVPLEYANLTLVYPSGTRSAENPDKDVRDEKKLLGVVAPGQVVEYRTKAIFLGEENMNKELRAGLEFRFDGINSVFTKEDVRQIRLLASPVNLVVETLKEITSGQELTLAIKGNSNTAIPLRDILVRIDYPQGFTYADAQPKPTFGNNIWRIGKLDPSEKINIKVKGALTGVDSQEKVFHTKVGAGNDQTSRDLSTIYVDISSALSVRNPFIGVSLDVGSALTNSGPVVRSDEVIGGKILWQNNLPSKIYNAQIEVRLSGNSFDKGKVNAGSGGFFRSADNTIFWDERGAPNLKVLDVGSSGSVEFSLSPIPSVENGRIITDASVSIEVTVRGKRFSEAGVPEEIKTIVMEKVRIASQVQVASRAVYYSGPFQNKGPIPPRVEQETTYTIIWTMRGGANVVKNPVMKATLPSYVSWIGSISPLSEDIKYDPATHQVVWISEDLPSGTGIVSPPKEVAFQVALFPSLSQLKTAPILLYDIQFEASDGFTGHLFNENKDDITTMLEYDPKASVLSGVVSP